MDPIDCTIIIPTFNTCEVTLQCIQNLRDAPPRVSHEIIVVDNKSMDGTVDRIAHSFPELAIVNNPANLGFSKACNRAAGMARGRFLCFLNSDTFNTGSAIDQLVAWLVAHPKTGIVGPELRAPTRGTDIASPG